MISRLMSALTQLAGMQHEEGKKDASTEEAQTLNDGTELPPVVILEDDGSEEEWGWLGVGSKM
jgi:hypothetical protein